MDPLLDQLLRVALLLVFGSAALHKARDRAGFARTLAEYQLLPERIVSRCVPLLIAVEAGVAALLSVPGLRGIAAFGATTLLLTYSGAIAINLRRGRRDIDCGCMGPGHRQPLSGWLLLRNGVLSGAALLVALEPAQRSLGLVDAFSFSAGLAGLALLFAAANQLGAQASRVQALRRSA